MKSEDDPSNVYQEVVTILERNFKYLVSVNLDSPTAIAYKKIVRFLKHRSQEEIESILEIRTSRDRPTRKPTDPQLSDEQIEQLIGKEILSILSSTTVTRKFLERLAAVRFGVSTGALSALRNRNALVDKLRIMVDHENTHDAISRVLRSDEN